MNNSIESNSNPTENPSKRRRPRWSMILILLLAWFVTLMPFLFWKATWFGTRLTDRQIAGYLDSPSNPRQAQHALVQISDRLSQGDRSVAQFYPQVVVLAESPVVELRMTAAWLMGQANEYPSFQPVLRKLVADADPLVRWNAALALVRFNDSTGRPALHEMLRPFNVEAPVAGVFRERLKPEDSLNRGTLMARVVPEGKGGPVEVRSPIPGRIQAQLVRDGIPVPQRAPLFIVSPDEKDVWEALRAFYLIGEPADLSDIQSFLHPGKAMSTRIQQQAQLTVEAIQRRSEKN